MDKYNWEGINYPSEKDDWKKFEKYDLTIALNVLYDKNKKIYPALVSKSWKRNHFLNDSKQRWMILWCRKKGKIVCIIKRNNVEKSLWFLLFRLFPFVNNRKQRLLWYYDASWRHKILEFNQYPKSDKAPFIIYADLCVKIILKIHPRQK